MIAELVVESGVLQFHIEHHCAQNIQNPLGSSCEARHISADKRDARCVASRSGHIFFDTALG
jgi:hypothetical protein